jgi:hypothetical protein
MTSQAAQHMFEGHQLTCTAIALSPDERMLCSGSRGNSIVSESFTLFDCQFFQLMNLLYSFVLLQTPAYACMM